MYEISELFDLEHTQAAGYLSAYRYPWEALTGLKAHIRALGNAFDKGEYTEITHEVWIHRGAKLAPTAHIDGPTIVGEGTEVRHGAYIRGGALIGKGCVVGNSTELKNCILFDGVQVPHYNYVGDSILGFKAHMGAGAITSNVKSDKSPVVVRGDGESVATGLKKLGSCVGDRAEIGCNSVLNPGTVIGRNATVYPLSCVRGTVAEDCIFKRGEIVRKY